MKGKKTTLGALKKKLWTLTSLYVRLSASDHTGMCSCVTCGATKNYKEMQAGHFVPKAQGNSVYFDLRNIHVQCYRCNINLGGNGAEYYPFMVKTYGEDVVEEIRSNAKKTIKFTKSDYEEMIADLQQKLKEVA